MYLLIVRMNAANKRRGIDILSFTVSASNGRAAVAAGDDLRGLGNCHQQAFWGICRNGKSPKISKLTEVCIACRFVNLYYSPRICSEKSHTIKVDKSNLRLNIQTFYDILKCILLIVFDKEEVAWR